MTDQPTDTDMRDNREVSLPIRKGRKMREIRKSGRRRRRRRLLKWTDNITETVLYAYC